MLASNVHVLLRQESRGTPFALAGVADSRVFVAPFRPCHPQLPRAFVRNVPTTYARLQLSCEPTPNFGAQLFEDGLDLRVVQETNAIVDHGVHPGDVTLEDGGIRKVSSQG